MMCCTVHHCHADTGACGLELTCLPQDLLPPGSAGHADGVGSCTSWIFALFHVGNSGSEGHREQSKQILPQKPYGSVG